MIKFLQKLSNHKLRESTEKAAEQLRSQKPKVNAVSSWLENRANENGFGEDFEYTLRPRGAK